MSESSKTWVIVTIITAIIGATGTIIGGWASKEEKAKNDDLEAYIAESGSFDAIEGIITKLTNEIVQWSTRYDKLEKNSNQWQARFMHLNDNILKKFDPDLSFQESSSHITAYAGLQERNRIGFHSRGKVYLSRGPIPTQHLTPGWPVLTGNGPARRK